MPEPIDPRRRVVVLVLLVLLAVQMVAVSIAALPQTRLTAQAAPVTRHLDPFFNQDWKLFAPNPLNADRVLRLQAAYRDADGRVETGRWLDWSDVELALVRHRLVGGRAGYVTNKMWAIAQGNLGSMGPVGATLVGSPVGPAQAITSDELRDRLVAAGQPFWVARNFTRFDEALTILASDALTRPGRELVAVRYQLYARSVTPYDLRDAPRAVQERARQVVVDERSGWRVPQPSSSSARRAVQAFEERHG